ncbi:unnamed protein product [Adineta steineri]|uniref:Uncharacterized protein n=1 Tax=Adineta steineri TaxID=433720 RepID=A0A818XJZ3_9BILA|nr:unnamed protein product [Adineta steineri]
MNSLIRSDMTFNNPIPWRAAIDRLKFQKRSCTTFIPKETNKECCVCNYTHSKSDVPHANEVWNWKMHTKQEVTNCYGILPQSTSPYLRCDVETDLEQLCFVLLGVWGMAIPSLIMRMIGDIDTTPNIKIEKELLQSISDAAVASDAWIITNGYKEESISELVGEVMYNCRMNNSHINFSAIAVGKWGNIHNCHKLDERNHNTPLTTQKGHGRYKLELNHTEYIFFDDGTCDSQDTGEFASNFARQISRGARRRIPLITVLIGGTPHSLSSVYTDLKRLVPVVIVNGCGPLADTLYKYLKLTEGSYKSSKSDDQDGAFNESEDDLDIATINETFSEGDDETDVSSTKKTLKEMLRSLGKFRLDFVNDVRKLYNIVRQQNYETQGKRLPIGELLSLEEEKALGKYLYQMASCLNAPFRDNIHIFNIDSSKSLKETIYYAFVQARDNLSQTKKKYHKTIDEQLHLALRWSIGDTTENQSATTAKIWNDTNKIKQNRLLLIDALSKNMLMFVMNFMKLDIDFTVLFRPTGTPLTKVATHWSYKYHYLQELYSDTKRKNNDPLYLLDQISSKLTFTEEKHLVIVLQKLVGDFMLPLYETQSDIELMSLGTERDDDKENTDAEHIYRDLFLWCILTYRLDMAKIFLSQLKTRICSALIASKILKSLAAYAPDQVAKDTLFAKANDFETHAIEFVRCAYINDKHKACELIMRCTNLYGGVTCLQMAIAADNKRFLHEDACQALLTNIWYDKVDPVQERKRLVVNILTFGISQFFISIYLKYFSTYTSVKPESHIIKHERPKRQLKKNGIDYTDDYGAHGTIFQHFFHFHNRPIVKYCYTCFGYVLFLLFFSYYMLFAFFPLSKENPNIHWTEILTIITVTTMLFEEIRQLLSQDNRSLIGKIRSYFDINNRISNLFLVLPAYLLFYIGLALRFTQKDAQGFLSARIVMALDLELLFIRSVLFIGIASDLGPKIVMIRKMTNDLILFIIVIVIFIFGYGVSSRSMTAYGTIDFKGRNIFRDIVYPVYYFVHGSFDNERTQLEATPDSGTTIVTQVIFAFHMLFVNILLINLLIALFSFTINDIQTQARYVWAYDRCDIIRTYHARPALFPPFTFLISIMQCCRWCWRKLHRNRYANKIFREEQSQCFKMIPINDDVDHAWSEFERYSTNGYIRQLLDDQATALVKGTTADVTSDSTSNNADELKRIKTLVIDIQKDLEDSQTENNDKLESMKSTITDLQTRFVQMESRCDRWITDMKEITTSMNWMMMAMANAKMGESEPPLIRDTSRTSSISQKRLSDTIYNRSNQQLNKEYATAGQPLLQQEQSVTPEVRIEMALRTNNNNDI